MFIYGVFLKNPKETCPPHVLDNVANAWPAGKVRDYARFL